MNEDSILNSVKKLIGIDEEDPSFDTDLILCINSVFVTVQQIGVGDDTNIFITSSDEKWSELPYDMNAIAMLKTYVAHKVQQMFDPPSGAAKDALERIISEEEYRLNMAYDILFGRNQ